MKQDLFNLHGKVAIITGGNRGIGKGIARGLARYGADIAIVARDEVKTAETVKEIKEESGVRVIGLHVDLHEEQQINDMGARVFKELGRVDVLVNNAGTNQPRGKPQELTGADWDEVQNTNLRSAFLCSKAVYPELKKHGGKIIMVSSVASFVASAGAASYCASKGGMSQLAKSLAVAWGPDNIQVNSIFPAFVNTDMNARMKKLIPTLHDTVAAGTPLGRWGEPEDFAGPAIFLASQASDFMTGGVLLIDGGYTSVFLRQ